ncbi:hypothetical protein Golob_003893, partial [Gossypium lobatum]|nr:hypothetical protein [Gossypium lobatum]
MASLSSGEGFLYDIATNNLQ